MCEDAKNSLASEADRKGGRGPLTAACFFRAPQFTPGPPERFSRKSRPARALRPRTPRVLLARGQFPDQRLIRRLAGRVADEALHQLRERLVIGLQHVASRTACGRA